jgi:hypothetical protein
MTIWLMCIACWIPKATNTHSQYVIHIAFPLQKCLHNRAPMLRYTHIVYLVVHRESGDCKAWLTVEICYIRLQAMLRISKYMWLEFIYFFKMHVIFLLPFFANVPYQ